MLKFIYVILISFGLVSCGSSSQDSTNQTETPKTETPPSKTGDTTTSEESVSTFKAINNLISITPTEITRNGISFGADLTTLDVDGDGVKELLVGASTSDIDGSNSGIIYVYKKEGTGFATKASSLIHPPITNGYIYFASSLALGDIDNDGNKDLLVGAPGDDSCGGTDRGAVYVYYYKSSGIDSSPNLKICYPVSSNSAYFGYDIAVGDVDQDGKDDILISANRDDTGGTDRGRAYLFMNDGDWSSDQTFYYGSGANYDYFGSFVAFIHANSDDFLDIAVGVYAEDYNSATNNGSVYIYYNNGSGAFANPSTPDIAIRPNYAGNYNYFGYSGLAVDLNGDSRQDLLVSMPGIDGASSNIGLVLGYTSIKDDTSSGDVTEKTPDILINYPDTSSNNAYFGYWMGKGDFINGSAGFALSINDSSSSINKNHVYFYEENADSNTQNIFSLKNENTNLNPYTNFGSTVKIGDIDGDGIRDLIIGIPYEDELYNGWSNVGLVQIYLGVANDTFRDTVSYILRPPYPVSGEMFGYSLELIDVNGDSKKDLLVGAPSDDLSGDNAGTVYVFFGGKDVFDVNSDMLISDPEDGTNNWFGSSIVAGDLNGDSYPDLVIGAERDDTAGSDRGAVYIWRTDASTVDITALPSQTITCSFAECSNSCYFGSSLAILDIDPSASGDNYKDLLIGSERLDNTGTDAGAIFVFKGTSGSQGNNDVPTGTYSFINDPSDHNSNYFGASMSVGDFDGDGIEDLIVGADREDSYFTDSGAVYFWYIKNSSFNISTDLPNFRYYGNTSMYQNLGSSVATVDINNDGTLDLVVGAQGYDVPKQDIGILYIDSDYKNR